MFKVIATNVVVSKGYDNNPALRFSGQDDCCVSFRVGEKVYDKNAENNTRWINHTVKAFGTLCERIKKMKLKEGSFINFSGQETEEVWPDPDNKDKKKSARVIILDDIEYAAGGGKKSEGDNQGAKKSADSTTADQQGGTPEDSANFEGYSALGGDFFGDD